MSSDSSKKSKNRPKFFISPSGFASHFHFNCHRQLVFTSAHIDRARWFFLSKSTHLWEPFSSSDCITLELAFKSDEKCVQLEDGSTVSFDSYIQSIIQLGETIQHNVLRSNWYYEKILDQSSQKSVWQPFSAENCAILDRAMMTPNQPVEILLDGIDYVANMSSGVLLKRHFDKDPPSDTKPIKFQKAKKPDESNSKDIVSEAFTSGGDLWETLILDILKDKGDRVFIGTGSGGIDERASDKKISFAEFLSILKNKSQNNQVPVESTDQKIREWIYQPSLESPVQLYNRLGLKKSEVTFSTCYPDFLEILPGKEDGCFEILIVDAKATDHLKLSHRIQVGIYYFIIDAILAAYQLNDKFKVSKTGGVWLRGQKDFITFDLSPIITYLSDFFQNGLWKQLTVETPLKKVAAQLSSKCSNCNFSSFCKSEANRSKTELSLIYGVSEYEKTYVRNFLEQEEGVGADEVLDIEQIHELLEKHSAPKIPVFDQNDPENDSSSTDTGISTPILSRQGSTVGEQEKSSNIETPTKPSRQSSNLVPRTPSNNSSLYGSAPSTPQNTSSSNLGDQTPTKELAPASPFPASSLSNAQRQLSFDVQVSEAPSQPFEVGEEDFFTSTTEFESKLGLKPLNRHLWSSLMKIKAYVYNQPVIMNQPTMQMTSGEDIPIFISISSDRPNGHICAWAIETRASQPIKSIGLLESELINYKESHQNGPNQIIITSNSANLQVCSSLTETLPAYHQNVEVLKRDLINCLFAVMNFVSLETSSKTTSRIYVFAPSESSSLCDILLKEARKSEFVSVTASTKPHLEAKLEKQKSPKKNATSQQNSISIQQKALKLLVSIFKLPDLITVPHQPKIAKVTGMTITILRNQFSSMLALPLFYDADFDDFYDTLCLPVSKDDSADKISSILGTGTKLSQKGILSRWYSLITSKKLQNHSKDDKNDEITSEMSKLFGIRATKMMNMISSFRRIFGVQATDKPSSKQESADSSANQSFLSLLIPFTSPDPYEFPNTRFSLILEKSKHFEFAPTISTFHPSISKLLFMNNYDLYSSSMKKMVSRQTIAYRDAHQLEERVVSLVYVGTVQGSTPKKNLPKTFHEFTFTYMSESLSSALQQDAMAEKAPVRWLISSNSAEGICGALEFNDLAHANSGLFKFSPPQRLAFASPKDFRLPNTIILDVKLGKAMTGLNPKTKYFLSEFEVDLTSDLLKNALTSIDLRIAIQNHLSILKPLLQMDQEQKIGVNNFLNWLLQHVSSLPKKIADAKFSLNLDYLLYFEMMGGFKSMFLETTNQIEADDESLNNESENDQTIKLRFIPEVHKVETIGVDIAWAIKEFIGEVSVGTRVALALLEDPLPWGSSIPADFKDQTDDIKRLQSLIDLISSCELMTRSQVSVLNAVLNHKLTCVWGPPGTGKTYFLANMMLLFTEAHRKFRLQQVLITKTEQNSDEKTPSKAKKSSSKRTGAKKTSSMASPASSSSSDPSITEENIDELTDQLKQKVQISEPVKTELESEPKSTESSNAKSSDPSTESSNSKSSDASTEISNAQESSKPKEEIEERLVEVGNPFRIAVIAFTHAAIDNLLAKFMEEDKKFRSLFASEGSEIPNNRIPVARLISDKSSSLFFRDKTFDPEDVPTALSTSPQLEEFFIHNSQCVVGSTVWSMRKYASARTAFDMIVIDEASQLLLAQALIPTQFLIPSGRLVVAGDHYQLPPILDTVYPEDPQLVDSVKYAKSTFEYLKIMDPESKLTHMLHENWRSCTTLGIVPSSTIYKTNDPSKRYHPANEKIASQQFWLSPIESSTTDESSTCSSSSTTQASLDSLSSQISSLSLNSSSQPKMFNWVGRPELKPIPIASPLLQLMFDSTKPMVVIVLKKSLHGVSLDSFPQAKLIAGLASAVRKASQVLFPSVDDSQFWKSKLLVVAPHHVQRHRIRDHLIDSNKKWSHQWDREVIPAIETVEKAQGRQFTSVIMDYGIIDNYRLSKEMSFLYSRNRINVAQTRAESKCVMIVSDVMLQMQKNVYISQSIQDGFTYLQHFVQWAREQNLVTELYTDQIDALCNDMEQDPFFSAIKTF